MSLRSLSCLLAISCSTLLHAADVPTFAGPTPGTLRSIFIPTVDISGDASRHVIIARGTEKEYQGHCDTVLMADGKTMFTAWCMNHAGHLGPLARSDDAGLTWTPPLSTPPDWQLVKMTTPVLHRLTDPQGVERLFIFGGCDFPGNLRSAFSTDLGKTWSPMKELGLVGEVAPKSILSFDGGKRLVMWSDRRDPKNAKDLHPVVWQSESLDGGLTWSKERVILVVPGQWAQPSVTRSDDGKQLVMLLRENTRQHHSLYSISNDDARTWSEPEELPAALTGDRHVIKHAPDGRLVIAFRDMAKTSTTYGHYVAWVGTFDDIVNRREGQYRIKLLHNTKRSPTDAPGTGNTDCGDSDLELLGDGTIIATTYIHYAAGPEKSSVVSTRFKLSETDALAKKATASTESLLPANWNHALAGEAVLKRLVQVTAPQVKGAHDAEFVCVGDRSYVVSEVNDLRGGEDGGWPFIYSTLSIVNLETLKTERVIDFAKGEQTFANEKLPVGACWVPRIIQKAPKTLRCYFVSQDPGKRQSQMWYRDFDLGRNEFAPTIHKAKLKTVAGIFDFQPQHFHADAVTHGFKKKASDSFFFVFDSFKKFDGKLYVALNNFTGQQNALALVHDDLATFEIIGHYNDPQSAALSESAVNRLPDGTWMAICRNDKGNYHFTTSKDGKTWTIGEPKPFVPNGLNSKPTFEKFGGIYYLGWQEAKSIQGANRSVFNVDISRDGKTWERKYSFETPQSFQYPAFREHEGAVWLCVTQGDTDPSRKERIMFGKLEDTGAFESQEGKKRIRWPAQHPTAKAAFQTSEPVSLSADHAAIVNHQRRIFFQYDPAADIQRKGGFGADMDMVMSYVFDAACQTGSQLDAICIDVSNEGVAHYRSKIFPAIQHPGLMKWREQDLDYFDELIKQGRKRDKEIWWGLRMNEVERGHLATYDIKTFAEMKERNPVKAAHPDWLIRSWWWQGFWNYAVKEVRDYRLSIVREVAEQYDFDGVHLDFLRHTPFLPPGKQWENREHLTSFMRDARLMLQSQAAKRGRPFMLAARVPDSVEGCHADGLDIETWAREGLVDVLILGTRTIKVDVDSFRKAMAGAHVKLMPSFDCFHATDGYHGDQSLDLVCGVFGNYLHQGADGVGAFNGIIGFPEQAEKLGLTQTDTRDIQVFSTIGSLTTMSGRARYYPMDRRGGYAHNEGYGSSNNDAPLPIELRNDQAPSTLTLPIWERVNSGTEVRLRLVLFQHVESDEVTVQLNGTALKQDLVDAQWKDPRIFSPDLQPATVAPGALVKNPASQKLTRLEFLVPTEILKRGDNCIAISVNRKGPFPPSKSVKVEKVELHLK